MQINVELTEVSHGEGVPLQPMEHPAAMAQAVAFSWSHGVAVPLQVPAPALPPLEGEPLAPAVPPVLGDPELPPVLDPPEPGDPLLPLVPAEPLEPPVPPPVPPVDDPALPPVPALPAAPSSSLSLSEHPKALRASITASPDPQPILMSFLHFAVIIERLHL